MMVMIFPFEFQSVAFNLHMVLFFDFVSLRGNPPHMPLELNHASCMKLVNNVGIHRKVLIVKSHYKVVLIGCKHVYEDLNTRH